MAYKIIGYSERGLMNALVYSAEPGMRQGHLLGDVLVRAGVTTSEKFAEITAGVPRRLFEVYPEHSLSVSGTPDIMVLLGNQKHRSLVFIEGKVGGGKLAKELKDYAAVQRGRKLKNEASNLFVQLARKMKLVTALQGRVRTNSPLVKEVSEEIQKTISLQKKYSGKVDFHFIGLIPDAPAAEVAEALEVLRTALSENFTGTDLKGRVRLLTWSELKPLKKKSTLFREVYNREKKKIH